MTLSIFTQVDEDEDDQNDDEGNDDEDQLNEARTSQVAGFNCRLCGSSSESHIDMIKCMETHKNETSIQCEQCQLYFLNSNQLEMHEILCHPQEDFDEDDSDEADEAE